MLKTKEGKKNWEEPKHKKDPAAKLPTMQLQLTLDESKEPDNT